MANSCVRVSLTALLFGLLASCSSIGAANPDDATQHYRKDVFTAQMDLLVKETDILRAAVRAHDDPAILADAGQLADEVTLLPDTLGNTGPFGPSAQPFLPALAQASDTYAISLDALASGHAGQLTGLIRVVRSATKVYRKTLVRFAADLHGTVPAGATEL